ncbi:hypothetical protein [Enterobacter asburiae]|uniref:hypothetical protein n=1 Tax=Enterobacter asburiae TaxID=61645 RepID=UPI002FD6440D
MKPISKLDQTLIDFKKIFEIIIQYNINKESFDEEIFDRFYYLNSIPHNTYGNIVIGRKGSALLNSISERHLPKDIEDFVSSQYLYDIIRDYVFKIIILQGKEIDKSTITKIIDLSLKELKKKEVTTTFFIPFCFFSNFEFQNFEYGDIKIHSLDNFKYLDNIQKHSEFCLNYYKQFNAIAEVKIKGIDTEVAKYKAERVVSAFLGICRLIPNATKVPLSTSPNAHHNKISFNMTCTNSSNVEFEHKIVFNNLTLPNWDEVLLKTKNTFFDIMKKVISLQTFDNKDVLANRIIDSLIIYHNALEESSEHYKLVKLISSIERLHSTKTQESSIWTCDNCHYDNIRKKPQVVSRFQKRGIALLELMAMSNQGTKEKLKYYYNLRSEIVHGNLSLMSDNFPQNTNDLIELTGNLIVSSTLFYYKNGIFEVTNHHELDTLYEKLTDHLLKKRD